MDDNQFKKLAAGMLEGVDIAQVFREARAQAQEDQINFWVPSDYKDRYKALQKESNKRFGRFVKQVIMKCIDEAEESKAG